MPLPTGGTVVLEDGVTTTIEFLPTTPTTGEVPVQRGMLPATTVALPLIVRRVASTRALRSHEDTLRGKEDSSRSWRIAPS